MLGWLRQLKRQRQAEPAAAVSGTAPARADMDALLRQLDWTVLRRLDGALQGDHRSLFRGAGLDLADLREYQPHDDVRHIDWNVTARLQAVSSTHSTLPTNREVIDHGVARFLTHTVS